MALFRNVLREYLVKIKTEVDEEAKRKAFSEIDSTKSKLRNVFDFVGSGTLKAGAMVTSAIMGVNLLINKTIDSVSDADVAAGRFARKMWTTKENAQALLTTFDAIDSSWEDLFYMTNEEFERFTQLKAFASSLTPPDDLNDTLYLVRDINEEVDKMQILLQYAQKWFVAAFGAYAKEDLIEIRDGFRNLVELGVKYLPVITDKLAQVAYIFFRLARVAVWAVSKLGSALFTLLDRIPNSVKVAGLAVTGFLGLFSLGPVGAFIAAILALLLLLDDFYVWQKGGKSLLGDTWQKMTDYLEDQDNILNNIWDTIVKTADTAGILIEGLADLTAATIEWADEVGIIEGAFDSILTIVKQILTLFSMVADVGSSLGGAASSLSKFVRGEITFDELMKDAWEGTSDLGHKLSQGFWDFILPLFGTDRESVFGTHDYYGEKAARENSIPSSGYSAGVDSTAYWMNQAFASSVGSSRGAINTTTNNNQTNNINVQQSPGESAEMTGYKLARSLLNNRNFFSPVN